MVLWLVWEQSHMFFISPEVSHSFPSSRCDAGVCEWNLSVLCSPQGFIRLQVGCDAAADWIQRKIFCCGAFSAEILIQMYQSMYVINTQTLQPFLTVHYLLVWFSEFTLPLTKVKSHFLSCWLRSIRYVNEMSGSDQRVWKLMFYSSSNQQNKA